MDGAIVRAFLSFFAIIDPLGNVLVFHLLTVSLSPARRARVAGVAISTAAGLLILFSLAGRQVLAFIGISAESFQVAAGLLLLLPAYNLVARGEPLEIGQDAIEPTQVAVVPLATPLLAGPGALATAISLSATLGRTPTILALGLVLVLTGLVFLGAARLFHWLGAPLLRLLSRLVGILLFAIAVDYILKGSQAFFWPHLG